MDRSPLCRWSEIPEDHCPHCTGDLSLLRVVCNHGNLATECDKCAAGAPRQNRGVRPERYTLTGVSMGALRIQETEYEVVLGPCPGCQNWQLDYTMAAANSYAEMRYEPIYEFGSEDPVSHHAYVDMSAFHSVVEDALQEHLDECPHLQRLIDY